MRSRDSQTSSIRQAACRPALLVTSCGPLISVWTRDGDRRYRASAKIICPLWLPYFLPAERLQWRIHVKAFEALPTYEAVHIAGVGRDTAAETRPQSRAQRQLSACGSPLAECRVRSLGCPALRSLPAGPPRLCN